MLKNNNMDTIFNEINSNIKKANDLEQEEFIIIDSRPSKNN